MCLILFAFRSHPDYPLVLAANRDEFLDRPTLKASFWEDSPGIIGGRDLKCGGTWLGVSIRGRLAAVTNYREPGRAQSGAPSRGLLVKDFLTSDLSPTAYLDRLVETASKYNGFNLLVWENGDLGYYSNRSGMPAVSLSAGVHGLSNDLLDTPWPKVEAGKRALEDLIDDDRLSSESLLELLSSRDVAPDDRLPDTGVGLETERALSPMFIRTNGYGTRCSTAILIDNDSIISILERSYDAAGDVTDAVEFELRTAE